MVTFIALNETLKAISFGENAARILVVPIADSSGPHANKQISLNIIFQSKLYLVLITLMTLFRPLLLCILIVALCSILLSIPLGIAYKHAPNKSSHVSIPDYDILEIPDFLSHKECDQIIEMSANKLFPSRVYSSSDDVFETNTRKSEQCWLDDTSPLISNLSTRVKNATNCHDNPSEHLQVVKYGPGGFYTPHFDACDGDSACCKRMDGELGPRLWTLLIYLNDDYTGGETVFPKINKSVTPQKGKAVLFKNVDDNGAVISHSFHGGNPVSSGQKWIANKWIRLPLRKN
jgi:prolyl 4-hydroxylase